jgi:hypothetical protein
MSECFLVHDIGGMASRRHALVRDGHGIGKSKSRAEQDS